jgi:hypothetical protein
MIRSITALPENRTAPEMSCFRQMFVSLERLIKETFSFIADFFKHLFCWESNLNASRITTLTSINGMPQNRFPAQKILDFYNGEPNDQGQTLDYLINRADDQALEFAHGWVQWAFPEFEASSFNLTAPLLTEEIRQSFHRSPNLQEKLLKMFERALKFYGLKMEERTGVVMQGENFLERSAFWLKSSDHNHLRISRILKSLKALQDPAEQHSWSKSFFRYLKAIQLARHSISEKNFSYWQAIHPNL